MQKLFRNKNLYFGLILGSFKNNFTESQEYITPPLIAFKVKLGILWASRFYSRLCLGQDLGSNKELCLIFSMAQ